MAARNSASLENSAATSRGRRFGAQVLFHGPMMVSNTFFRAYHFEVASTMVQGAYSDSVSLQHLLGCRQILAVFLVPGPVGLGHAPRFQRVFLDHFEASALLLPADVQKEFQDHGAIVGQHALKFDDVAERLLPGLLRNRALHPLLEHATVPAVIEDDHLAAVRRLQPEAPQPRTLLLVGSRRGDGIEFEAARIQALGQRRYGGSLARRVPAFENNERGHTVVPARFLQIVQAQLQAGNSALVFFPGKLLLQVDVFQHGGRSILLRYERFCAGQTGRDTSVESSGSCAPERIMRNAHVALV